MTTTFLLAMLLGAPQAPPPLAERPAVATLQLIATDGAGRPVTGLSRDDVVVLEEGVAREVLEVKPDRRPLTLGVVLDTSAAVADSYRLFIERPLSRFLERLPADSQFAIWTTGERPTQLVSWSDDWQVAQEALRRVAPRGGSTLFDTIDLACEGLRRHEGQRFALVVLSALGVEHSARQPPRAVDPPYCAPAIVSVIEIRESSGSPLGTIPEDEESLETRAAYGQTFNTLTRQSGGRLESVLLAAACETALGRILADLKQTYLVRYLSRDATPSPRVKVEVARPRVKVRVAPESGGS